MGIIVEIDLLEHTTLINRFFSKKLNSRKYEKKIGCGYIAGNVFLKTKIYNGF